MLTNKKLFLSHRHYFYFGPLFIMTRKLLFFLPIVEYIFILEFIVNTAKEKKNFHAHSCLRLSLLILLYSLSVTK